MVRYLKRLKSSRLGRVQAFPMYGGLGMSAPSLHRESTDSLILSMHAYVCVICTVCLLVHGCAIISSYVAMILGFGERRQTVSEADIPSGQDGINIDIFITSLRRSEIDYLVGIRYVVEGQPIIEPAENVQNPMFDGTFGSREENAINNLVGIENLRINTTTLPALQAFIRDDILPEDEECFDLSIFPVSPQEMKNFMCIVAGDEFVCIHTICIEDDDG